MNVPNVKTGIKLLLFPSNFIFRKTLNAASNANVSLSSAIQKVTSSAALAIEKLRASGNNIKLLVPHTNTNYQHIATSLSAYTVSFFFINGEMLLKITLSFVKSASIVGRWTSFPHEFEIFGLSSVVCKVNGIPLYNLLFGKSYRTLILLSLSGPQYMGIF